VRISPGSWPRRQPSRASRGRPTSGSFSLLFLLPRLNERLAPRLMRLRPGTRIVSHDFDMGPAWPPDQASDVNGVPASFWIVR
jgi:hypothetical protein